MSQEHVDAPRSAYKRTARGDFSADSELPDDFELVLAPEMPDAGSYRGDRDAGDQVMIELLQRGWLAGSDDAVELSTWAVSTARAGAAVRSELFLSRAEGLEAVGLRE